MRHAGYEVTPPTVFHRQWYFNGCFDDVAPVGYFRPENVAWSANMRWPARRGRTRKR